MRAIIVGANIGNVPWEFQDNNGGYVGFEVDLIKEIGARLNRQIDIVNIPFNGLFAAVQSNRIDVAISSINVTNKRLESVSFTQPYYDSDQSLTVLSNSKIKGLGDLKEKIVAVDTGSTGDIWATNNQGKYQFGEIRRYEGLAPAMLDLVIGRTAGYISDIPALLYYTKDKPNINVVEKIHTGGKYSMMLNKNNLTFYNDIGGIYIFGIYISDFIFDGKEGVLINERGKRIFFSNEDIIQFIPIEAI